MKIYDHPSGKVHKVDEQRTVRYGWNGLTVTKCGYWFDEKFAEDKQFDKLPWERLCGRCFV
jgi:hypothetical protein